MTALTFDAATHTYRLNGNLIPGVSGILKPLMPDYGFADPTLGTLVHEATAALDQHREAHWIDCTREMWDAADFRVKLWLAFRAQYDFHPTFVEEPVVHTLHGYAGTVDRIGTWMSGEPVILDIKTGDPAPWHALQLAGYALAAERMKLCEPGIRRAGVYLQSTGVTVRMYDHGGDASAFLAALTLHKWRANNGC